MLPDTDLGGARLFSARACRGLTAARQSGQPKPVVSQTALEQETEPGADVLIKTLLGGLTAMENDDNKVRFCWNQTRPAHMRSPR
jgi:hypothetical protein